MSELIEEEEMGPRCGIEEEHCSENRKDGRKITRETLMKWGREM